MASDPKDIEIEALKRELSVRKAAAARVRTRLDQIMFTVGPEMPYVRELALRASEELR